MVAGCCLVLAIGSLLVMDVGCVNTDTDGAYGCVHDDIAPSPDDVVYADTVQRERSPRTLSDTFQPIRLHVHYDESIIRRLSSDTIIFIKQVLIPAATEEFRLTLRVRRSSGPIRLTRSCVDYYVSHIDALSFCTRGCNSDTRCSYVSVPSTHLQKCRELVNNKVTSTGLEGNGVRDADFILYVSAINTSPCQHNAIAEARHCQLEPDLDRPIAGNVNVCPGELTKASKNLAELKLAVTHELTHVMGFSKRLFPFFRDPQGVPLVLRSITGLPAFSHGEYVIGDRVVRQVTRTDWRVRTGRITRNMSMLVTPAVTAEVRRHFNCPTLEGAELENQGSSGSSLSHLEKRAFQNEIMTAVPTGNPVLTRISLAVLQDSGWYEVNYTHAKSLAWGKGLGCDFAMKSCMDWMEIRRARGASLLPYCADSYLKHCSMDGRYTMMCNIYKRGQDLPEEFQNYAYVPGDEDGASAKYGGSVEMADYCAFPQIYNVKTSSCAESSNNLAPRINNYMEVWGNKSRCFKHGEKWRDPFEPADKQTNYGCGCYSYTCNKSSESYYVHIANKSYHCDAPGKVLKVDAVSSYFQRKGTLVCASYEDTCVVHDCYSAAKGVSTHCGRREESPRSGSTGYPAAMSVSTIVLTFGFVLTFADVLVSAF